MATDRLIYTLYVHPKLFAIPPAEVADKLAPLLNIPTNQLIQKFKEKETGIRLANQLTESVARGLKQLSLDGVELEEKYARYYPQDDVAADVIGYVDKEHRGQAGLERGSSQLLEVYTRDSFRSEWATTQNNLGTAYSDRIRGERVENLELAIVAYNLSLEVYTRDSFPYEWATTQKNF